MNINNKLDNKSLDKVNGGDLNNPTCGYEVYVGIQDADERLGEIENLLISDPNSSKYYSTLIELLKRSKKYNNDFNLSKYPNIVKYLNDKYPKFLDELDTYNYIEVD